VLQTRREEVLVLLEPDQVCTGRSDAISWTIDWAANALQHQAKRARRDPQARGKGAAVCFDDDLCLFFCLY
jgi:hypothetical protein